jgi:predicted DNA-binding transcriptional regulator AlpA
MANDTPVLVPLLLRDVEVAELLGICRAQVWKLAATAADSGFPRPVRVGGRTARWERAAIVGYVRRLADEAQP